VGSQLVKAREDAAKILDLIDKAFDKMTFTIQSYGCHPTSLHQMLTQPTLPKKPFSARYHFGEGIGKKQVTRGEK
jgi:hypothetical protein